MIRLITVGVETEAGAGLAGVCLTAHWKPPLSTSQDPAGNPAAFGAGFPEDSHFQR